MGGVELDPGTRYYPHEISRSMETFDKLFFEQNVAMRFTCNTLAMFPPLIVNESQIDEIVTKIRKTLETAK